MGLPLGEAGLVSGGKLLSGPHTPGAGFLQPGAVKMPQRWGALGCLAHSVVLMQPLGGRTQPRRGLGGHVHCQHPFSGGKFCLESQAVTRKYRADQGAP